MLRISLTLAAAGAALFAAPAIAEDERETQTVGVQFADLNLATEDGRKELDKRIDHAARTACGMDERATGSNMADRTSRKCYRDAKRQMSDHFARMVDEQNLGG
jgi:UrcA family protein